MQRISATIRELYRRGRITPPAGVVHSRHRKPLASAEHLTRAPKTAGAQLSIARTNSFFCSNLRPSHPARIAQKSNNSPSPDSDKTIAPRFLHNNALRSSGILPTPEPLEVVLHHRPDDTS